MFTKRAVVVCWVVDQCTRGSGNRHRIDPLSLRVARLNTYPLI
jgi:hypothetical protein